MTSSTTPVFPASSQTILPLPAQIPPFVLSLLLKSPTASLTPPIFILRANIKPHTLDADRQFPLLCTPYYGFVSEVGLDTTVALLNLANFLMACCYTPTGTTHDRHNIGEEEVVCSAVPPSRQRTSHRRPLQRSTRRRAKSPDHFAKLPKGKTKRPHILKVLFKRIVKISNLPYPFLNPG